MQITIKYSSFLKIYTGVDQDQLELISETALKELPRLLMEKYAKLPLNIPQAFFVVNGKIPHKDQSLADGDVVEIYQALAGG